MATPPDNWNLVKELFEAALEEEPARRPALLLERCLDANVRAEVQRLLAEHDQAGTFLSTPVVGSLTMRSLFLPREQDTRIDGYRLIEELGSGGMGVVYKAFDPGESRFVAIKMIGQARDIRTTVHAGARSRNAAFNVNRRMLLVREASLAGRLHHPNIVRVFDYGQFRGLLYMIMEYLEGRSLDRVIAEGNGLRLDQRLEISAQLLDALAFAHSHGIIHRDVKPSNTFLCASGLVKVLDFGLVATFSQIAQGRVMKGGTLFYMAPEALVGGSDYRVDIWAAGLTIYELITGEYPFAAPSTGETLHNIFHMPCPALPGSLPRALELHAILAKSLHKDPQHRYADAGKFANDLRQVGSSASTYSIDEQSRGTRLASSSSALTADLKAPEKDFEGQVAIESRTCGVRKIVNSIDMLEYFPIFRSWFFTSIWASIALGMISAYFSFNEGAAVIGFGVNYALMFLGFLLIGGPKLALVPLAMAEFWSMIPRCRTCNRRMRDLDRITRFAFSPIEIQFAFADCIAALQENLWVEAVKLFSIHTHEHTPTITNRIADAPLRYHLSLYDCPHCGQRCAEFITDDKDGERWMSRPEYVRAHQTSHPEHAPTAFSRAMTTLRTIGQAVKAGFSRTAFPRAVFLGLLAIAIFFAVGWVLSRVIGRGPWERTIPHSHVR